MSLAKVTVFVVAFAAISARAESTLDQYVTFSGFGTLGVVHSNYGYADFTASVIQPYGAGYSRSWTATPDSDLGVQANVTLTDSLSGVVQILSRDDEYGNFKPDVEWANLNYQFTPDLGVRVGRILLPTYEFADNRNVGYSLPWLRIPVEITYASNASHSDGIDALYRITTGAVFQNLELQLGTTTEDLPGSAYTSSREHVALFSDTIQYGNGSVRLVYQQCEPLEYPPSHLKLLGMGFSVDPGPWFVLGDSNYSRDTYFGDVFAWYLSAGLRLGHFSPYATYSSAHQNAAGTSRLTGLGNQHTVATGVRWDFAHNVDFKLQLAQSTLDALEDPVSFANVQPEARIGDKPRVVSLALDFVF